MIKYPDLLFFKAQSTTLNRLLVTILLMTSFSESRAQPPKLNLELFADTSWIPPFLLSWISSMAAEELATTYRDIIAGSKAPKESE
jgi:hypothetical protein